MCALAIPRKTDTVDWHRAANDALLKAKKSIQQYPDSEEIAPDAATYVKVKEFFGKVSEQLLSVVQLPYVNAGPNGELCLDWILKTGTLNLVFYEGQVHGFLKTQSCALEAEGLVKAIDLVARLARA